MYKKGSVSRKKVKKTNMLRKGKDIRRYKKGKTGKVRIKQIKNS